MKRACETVTYAVYDAGPNCALSLTDVDTNETIVKPLSDPELDVLASKIMKLVVRRRRKRTRVFGDGER